jgi:hypothetical protein
LVNVQLSSTDAHGVPWQASAAYRADAGGDVDLSTAAAISGSYHGISGMGLIWSMRALKPDPAGAYFWGDTPLAFTLAVSAHGTRVASASFQRKFSAGAIAETMESLTADGFVGEFWHPANTAARRPRIAVLGVSRGSEAAQLIGVYYPTLVHAVIASVPSNAAICSYPGCTGPAWTLHGQALPYTREFDNPSPADNPAAVIPDQRIQGPVFLDCGEADQTWTSCPYAQAILRLLDAHHDRWAHMLYAYPGAGHPVGTLVPYEPTSPVADPDYATDQQARALLWPHLLTFLAGLAHNPAS